MNILKTKHLYILASFFVFALVSVAGLNKVYAANLDITCDGDNCQEVVAGSSTLFNETNWYPGSTLTKTIYVINTGADYDCHLIMSASNPSQIPVNFATQLNTAIKKTNGVLVYGDFDDAGVASDKQNLQNLFDNDADLGYISQDYGDATYEWTLTFNKNADNTFADATTTFDLNLNFTCEPKGSDKKISSRRGGGGNNGTSGNVAGAATGGVANLFNFFAGAVAGAETVEQPAPEETPQVGGASTTISPEAVKGAANKICEVSGLLWLVFVAQFLLHIVAKFLFKERKTFYIAQLLILAAFISAFFLAFCVWWDVLVSLLIGIVALWFIKLFSD